MDDQEPEELPDNCGTCGIFGWRARLTRLVSSIAEEKLADSSAANAALSAQLENIAPQLAALEKALSESCSKLKEEQKLCRQAEHAQDKLEARYFETEGSLAAIREEYDAVHEELALTVVFIVSFPMYPTDRSFFIPILHNT